MTLKAFLSELIQIIGVYRYLWTILTQSKFSSEINHLGIVKANTTITTDVYEYKWTILTQSGTALRIIFGGGQTFKDFWFVPLVEVIYWNGNIFNQTQLLPKVVPSFSYFSPSASGRWIQTLELRIMSLCSTKCAIPNNLYLLPYATKVKVVSSLLSLHLTKSSRLQWPYGPNKLECFITLGCKGLQGTWIQPMRWIECIEMATFQSNSPFSKGFHLFLLF